MGVLRAKVVHRGNAYLKEYVEKVFIDGLPFNIQIVVRVFWGCEKYKEFLEDFWVYRYTSGENALRYGSSGEGSRTRQGCFHRGRQTSPVVLTITEARSQLLRNNNYFHQVGETDAFWKLRTVWMTTKSARNTLSGVFGKRRCYGFEPF